MNQVIIDGDNLQINTAANFAKLCGLRGVQAEVVWDGEKKVYVANGTPCGPSVHGLYEWLAKQPGVKA
jgi:hypothetical protein